MATKKRNTRSASKTDAVKLLTADHAKVKKLFRQFEKLKEDGDAREKSALVEEICAELIVHTTVEEEIFYPAVREAIDDEGLVDEADVEHESAKTLIAQLSRMRPGEDHYDARVTVLGEYIDHHVQEEQKEMFPKAKRARVDMAELGQRIMERKEQLQARHGR
jgi:hemerythrin superfamily protein